MQVFFEVWGIKPGGKSRIKIADYEEVYWQRAEKKAFALENQGYTKVVIFEKIRTSKEN